MNITLINVPIFYGSDIKGVELGPKELRKKNILNILRKYHTVYDLGNLYIPFLKENSKFSFHNKMKYLKPIVEINTNLAHTVYTSLNSGNFPLVIGGDHSLGLGSISGISNYHKDFAVLWIDAHGDINTDLTTKTGNIHGMPLAAAMGIGNDSLTNLYFKGTKIKKENVFILGPRDLDKGESDLILNEHLNVYSTEMLKKNGIENIVLSILNELKLKNISSIHLSFDIDCIDSTFVPGTGTPVSKGLSINEVKLLLKCLAKSNIIKSMDFVELNPLLDKNDMTSNLCIELLEWTFKYLK